MKSIRAASLQFFLLLAFVLVGWGGAGNAFALTNDALMTSQSVPAVMVAGQSYAVSVTMKNVGTTTWSNATSYFLGAQNPQDNTVWRSSNRVSLSAPVTPGQQAKFSFTVTAPSVSGTYNFQWKMVREFVEWFGAASTNVAVAVSAPSNDSQFVSQSVPTAMVAGKSYNVSVTMKNVGATTWTSASSYLLGAQNPQDNTVWRSPNRVSLPASVAPGQKAVFAFTVTAPSVNGTYDFQWKMVREFVEWFGASSANANVTVSGASGNEAITYFHNDLSGSPMLATDAGGRVVWRENYQPYGSKLNNQAASASNAIGFAGKPYDQNTGLSYMGARYYDPSIGRFTGVDSAGFAPDNLHSFNRYAYANNNPYKFVDPDGHSAIDVAFLAYDIGKLGLAMYSGVGVGAASIDVALSVVGVASPIPGVGEAMKAARVAARGQELARVSERGVEVAEAASMAQKASLESRVKEIHGALDSFAATRRTTAVMDTAEGARVVASGTRDLSVAQRAMLSQGEAAAKLPGAHAEVTLLNHAAQNGLSPTAMSVYWTICPACRGIINESGGQLTTPTSVIWLR